MTDYRRGPSSRSCQFRQGAHLYPPRPMERASSRDELFSQLEHTAPNHRFSANASDLTSTGGLSANSVSSLSLVISFCSCLELCANRADTSRPRCKQFSEHSPVGERRVPANYLCWPRPAGCSPPVGAHERRRGRGVHAGTAWRCGLWQQRRSTRQTRNHSKSHGTS